MSKPNSYFLTDKELDEIAKKVVSDLYTNKEILELKNNGRTLSGVLGAIVDRQITGIYSNIEGYKSLQSLLTNSIRFAVLTEKNTQNEAEFKKIREACERRKNMLTVLNRKYENESSETIKNEIEKTKEEVLLLETQLNDIASKHTDKPEIKKNILELGKKAYGILLRSDKTSEKFYIAICKHLNVKIPKEHFGYDIYQNPEVFKPYYMRNVEPKEDVYVPPALKYNYGQRRYDNNSNRNYDNNRNYNNGNRNYNNRNVEKTEQTS